MVQNQCGLTVPRQQPKLPENVLDFFSLKGKVASVTGASGGIGYEVALALAQAGADVAMWYNSNPNVLEQADELSKKYNVRIKAYKCTLTDSAAVENTIDQIVKDFGRIDIQVANAGVAWAKGPIVEYAEEAGREAVDKEWLKIVDVDLNGVYYVSRATGKYFKKQGSGSLVLTASMSGHIVNVPQMQTAYNAVKAGVLHLGKSLSLEWANFARVNTVSPGYIQTSLTGKLPRDLQDRWLEYIPMGRMANPRELVGAYLYLASDASSYVTGTDIRVDGGYCAF